MNQLFGPHNYFLKKHNSEHKKKEEEKKLDVVSEVWW